MTPPTLTPPKHLSFSGVETLERCAKSYFLKYIARAPKRPAVWLAGGSAVHEVTEVYDLLTLAEGPDFEWSPEELAEHWESAFDLQVAQARTREPNERIWAQSSAEPIDVWRRIGPGFVRSYIDWRQRSHWTLWTTPDGDPAIELDVGGHLPGCPVEIKGYVDRIFYDSMFDKRIVVDLKSGKNPPKSPAQFGTYSALTQAKYGQPIDLGVPFMNRKGTVGRIYDMAEYTPEVVGESYGKAWEKVQSGDFTADPSDCFLCDVQAACAAKNGPLAPHYDPAAPGYPIPLEDG